MNTFFSSTLFCAIFFLLRNWILFLGLTLLVTIIGHNWIKIVYWNYRILCTTEHLFWLIFTNLLQYSGFLNIFFFINFILCKHFFASKMNTFFRVITIGYHNRTQFSWNTLLKLLNTLQHCSFFLIDFYWFITLFWIFE